MVMSSTAGSAPDPQSSSERRNTPTRTDYEPQGQGSHREDRKTVIDREKEEHGGIKIGSAFFGFLTATGMTVLLTALAAAIGAAVGLATDTKTGEATSQATSSAGTVGIVGGIVLLVILFVAYYCGGYVAGRMARFDGVKQGFAVWLWAILIAVVVGVLGAVAGSEFNVLSQLNSFPRLPVGEGDLTTAGIVALVVVLAASLAGAVLGGLAGMRFHRTVDRTGLDR
jgi:ABC-type amino acid transport system permease subunit